MSDRTKVLIVLVLAAAARFAFVAATPDKDFLSVDGEEYRNISSNLAAGNGYSISFYRWFEPVPSNGNPQHPDFFRPPLLPLIGAVLYSLPGPWLLWAKGTALFLGVLLVLVGYLIAREIFGRHVAMVAAILLALYPYAIWYSARWSTEILMALCLMAAVLMIVRARSRPTWVSFAGVGAFLGLAVLARPNALLQALVLPFALLFGRPRRSLWPNAGFMILSLALVIGPWSLRNLELTGSPNPGTFFGPYNMWLGTNPRMDQMYRSGACPSFNDLQEALYRVDSAGHVREQERLGIFDVSCTGAYWFRQVADFVKAEPAAVVRIYAARGLHFLRPWPNPATSSRPILWLSLLSVGPLIVCSVHSLVRRKESRCPCLYLPILAGLLGSLPFVFSLRLRFPVFDPYLVLLAAPTVWLCVSWVKRSKA